MGSKHDSDQASITQILRIKSNQKLGEFSKQNDMHSVDLQQSSEMATSFKEIKEKNDKDAAHIFTTQILPLCAPTT